MLLLGLMTAGQLLVDTLSRRWSVGVWLLGLSVFLMSPPACFLKRPKARARERHAEMNSGSGVVDGPTGSHARPSVRRSAVAALPHCSMSLWCAGICCRVDLCRHVSVPGPAGTHSRVLHLLDHEVLVHLAGGGSLLLLHVRSTLLDVVHTRCSQCES